MIACGSFNDSDANGATVDLGWEPQYIMIKRSSLAQDWYVWDTMRGIATGGDDKRLYPNSISVENSNGNIDVTATGFKFLYPGNQDHIYMAIRGPMMVEPEAGTDVFNSKLITHTQSTQNITGVGFSPDLVINCVRSTANYGQHVTDRLRGVNKQLMSKNNGLETTTNGTALVSLDMDGFTLGSDSAGLGWNAYGGYTSVKLLFKRAKGFFDVVAYSGTASIHAESHSLGAIPELMIVKSRLNANSWAVYHKTPGITKRCFLHTNQAFDIDTNSALWNNTSPTDTTFTVGTDSNANYSGHTFIAYLFASLEGVSKVGSYTGTGSALNIDCGFSGGARFVLIKRTDSTGDWYIWDTERGIVTGNDPHLSLNTAVVEVTSDDSIDPYSTGFTVNQVAATNINVSSGEYIFLAIA